MTELTPLARKLRTAYHHLATTDRDDTKAWWNAVAETAEAELAAPRPVRLPTVEECHQAIGASCTNALVDPASVVLDLVASLNPAWADNAAPGLAFTRCYSPHVKADTPDPRLHVLARRLPDWPTDDLADLLAELDEAVTL